ncbi:DUF4198 domain-containing protein [Massilia sp. HP4]|uniref:DUF4198 domain-containing protein n=1 Tax=Massilia sp. HP4 TaxID=2562316 RepID=UPI0010C0761A|nr:DUF4198 domain-containing protein [Massilia sp. HP4]
MNKSLLASLVALAALAPAAQAHHVWLEQDGKTVTLQFGEFGLNQRETTPGLLDKFVAPRATLLKASGETELKLEKTAKGYVVGGASMAAGDAIVAQDNAYPGWETTKDGTTRQHIWIPAARLATSFAAQQPKLALDIVPTGTAGEFKVFYKGQPLPKAKVAITVPSGWSKEAVADANGAVRFDLPWKGTNVLETAHTDQTGGERAGVQYASASHTSSLTVVQPKGIAALAAGPALAPGAEH